MNYEDYKRSFIDNGIRTTPKERKANQVKFTYKYGDKEIKHLTSKQLGKILMKPRKVLDRLATPMIVLN